MAEGKFPLTFPWKFTEFDKRFVEFEDIEDALKFNTSKDSLAFADAKDTIKFTEVNT